MDSEIWVVNPKLSSGKQKDTHNSKLMNKSNKQITKFNYLQKKNNRICMKMRIGNNILSTKFAVN